MLLLLLEMQLISRLQVLDRFNLWRYFSDKEIWYVIFSDLNLNVMWVSRYFGEGSKLFNCDALSFFVNFLWDMLLFH